MRRNLLRLLGLLVALGIIAALVVWVGPLELVRAVRRLEPWEVAAAGGLYLALWGLKSEKWRRLLRVDELAAPWGFLTATLLAANTLNLVLPAKLGDTARGGLVAGRLNVPFARAMASSVLDRLFDFYAVLAVGGAALLLVTDLSVPRWVLQALGWSALLGLVAASVVIVSPALATRLSSKSPRLQAVMADVVRPVQSLRSRPGAILALFALACLVWLLEGATTMLVTLASGVHASFVLVVLAVMVANLTKVVPLTPGGIGTYEAALAAVLVLGGVAPAEATAIAIIDHALKNLGTLLPGALAIARVGLTFRQKEQKDASPPA